MKDVLNINIHGEATVMDTTNPLKKKLISRKTNAVHPQNMARVIASLLAKEPNGYIFKMCFGNGGTFFNSSNQIVYRAPNIIGASNLYNMTYETQVDEQSAGTPSTNYVVSSVSPNPSITSVVTIVVELGPGEPAGQAVADNVTTNPESNFVFDEIGLKTFDGLLLTHLIFSPIEKTANRAFTITYTLTVSVS